MSNIIYGEPSKIGNFTYNESVSDSGGAELRFQGVFQEAETPNQNKRIYSLPVMAREVERLQPLLPVFMAGDHPIAGED